MSNHEPLIFRLKAPRSLASLFSSAGSPQFLEIRLDAEAIVIPVGSGADQAVELAYREIDHLALLPSALSIGIERRRVVLPTRALEHEHDAARLRSEIAKRIAQRCGEERVRTLDREAENLLAISSRPAIASKAIVALLGAAYTATHLLGVEQDSPFSLVRFGAASKVLIADGEYFRLVAAGLLHANLIHIVMAAVAIASLGGVIERLLGPASFLIIFWIASFAGAGGSAALGGAVFSAGASAAAFGLLGAIAYSSWHFRTRMPLGFSQPLQWWLLMSAFVFILPIIVPVIDIAGHVVAFVAGAIVTGILVGAERQLPLSSEREKTRWIAAGVILAIVTAGIFGAVSNYLAPDPSALYRTLDPLAVDSRASSEVLNRYAWEVATQPGADEQRLRRAREVSERSLRAIPEEASALKLEPEQKAQLIERARLGYGDTLATVLHRLKDADGAIAMERELLDRAEPSQAAVFATQLARFMRARPTPAPSTEKLALSIIDQGRGLSYSVREPLEPGKRLIAYARAEQNDQIIGLVRVPIDAGTQTGTIALGLPWIDAEFHVGALVPQGETKSLPAAVWKADPEILALP